MTTMAALGWYFSNTQERVRRKKIGSEDGKKKQKESVRNENETEN